MVKKTLKNDPKDTPLKLSLRSGCDGVVCAQEPSMPPWDYYGICKPPQAIELECCKLRLTPMSLGVFLVEGCCAEDHAGALLVMSQ